MFVPLPSQLSAPPPPAPPPPPSYVPPAMLLPGGGATFHPISSFHPIMLNPPVATSGAMTPAGGGDASPAPMVSAPRPNELTTPGMLSKLSTGEKIAAGAIGVAVLGALAAIILR